MEDSESKKSEILLVEESEALVVKTCELNGPAKRNYANMGMFFDYAMKALLTIPIQSKDPLEVSKLFKRKLKAVDAIEVWLDQLKKSELVAERVEELCRKWTKGSKKKLVVVCKDPLERGKFKGTAGEKAELLLAAIRGGASYVDMGLHTRKSAVEKLLKEKKRGKMIISHHDFVKTPSEKRLRNIIKRMQERGADVVKIACMVESPADTERLMELAMELKKEKQRHIILGMGQLGIMTRVFAKQIGNELNFVSLERSTAPGQLSLEQMLQFQAVLGN